MTTIRDNVEAVHRLVTEELKVKHLRAVVGFSMGAEQAFQWAVSYPTFMDAIVATSGTAKCYGHGYVRLEGQIAALTTDPAWQSGDYTTPPVKGLEAFGMVWAGWLYSQEWWRQELWRTNSPAGTTFDQAWQAFRKRFSADANDYILQARTWQRHDVGTTPGFDGRRREGAAIDQGARSSTCRPKPICTFRSAMRATSRHSFRGDVHADSVVVGPHRRGREQSSGPEVPERAHRSVPEVVSAGHELIFGG